MNIDALTEKVEKPLQRAARRVQDVHQLFWFVTSFRTEARRIAQEEIGDQISSDLRDRVIYEWAIRRTKGGIGHLEPFPVAYYVISSIVASVVLLVLWRKFGASRSRAPSQRASQPPPYSASRPLVRGSVYGRAPPRQWG
jgi:hypothetical protein